MSGGKERVGKWSRYGTRFFGWVDRWARWWDWIGLAVLVAFIYVFGSWGILSFAEYEYTAGWIVTGFTIAVTIVAIIIRWAIYRFIQKKRMYR